MNEEIVEEFVKIESIFVRERNCHLLRGHFPSLFTDYYLHLMQYGLRNTDPCDSMFKDLLAYFTLHLVARPWAEQHAWTVNLNTPVAANLFVTGSSLTESVTGRIFTKDINVPESNLLFAQMYRKDQEPCSSVIKLHGDDPDQWVEDFYEQSEQRKARCFQLPNEVYTLISAQPDADVEWLEQLTMEEMARIDETEQTKVLETRKFRFYCGCTLDRILPTLSTMKDQLDELFDGKDEMEITCPRCAAIYQVTRKMLESL
ncbi:MAG: Hsp33 family molecular chaperone HslO [Akkermansia sp.]